MGSGQKLLPSCFETQRRDRHQVPERPNPLGLFTAQNPLSLPRHEPLLFNG
jgi:hypothetical protein